MSRLANILTWVQRIRRIVPIKAISVEVVRFDMQALDTPEISGIISGGACGACAGTGDRQI
jgi:hypothetical protein